MPYTGPEPTIFQIERQLHRMLQLSPFTERIAQAALLKATVEIGQVRKHVTEMALLKMLYRGNDDIDASVVRVQTKNLRKTIAEYYFGPGVNDLVKIRLPEPLTRSKTTKAQNAKTTKKKRLPVGKNYRPTFEYNLRHPLTVKYFTAWTKMCGPHLSLIPEAMKTFAQVLQEDPEYADAWFALGDAICFQAMIVLTDQPEERTDALSKAETAITTGRELAPDTWHAHASGAFLALLRGDFGKAQSSFEAAISINREMTEGHPAYLFFYLAANDLATSDLTESRALELMGNADLQALHGRMLEWSGKVGQAELYYRQALDLEPNNGLCHFGLARMLMRAGKTDEAKKHLERAEVLLGPEDLELWMAFERSADIPEG